MQQPSQAPGEHGRGGEGRQAHDIEVRHSVGVVVGGPTAGDCICAASGIDDVRVPIGSREIRFPPGKFISRELTTLLMLSVLF